MSDKLYYQIDDEVFEATGDILLEMQDKLQKTQAILSDEENQAIAKATAKAELLERLGITADEAKLLLA
jgi:hypothetical protein